MNGIPPQRRLALEDRTPISVPRRLRDDYRNRPRFFPWSLALIGGRDCVVPAERLPGLVEELQSRSAGARG
jgi:hypothetical protein